MNWDRLHVQPRRCQGSSSKNSLLGILCSREYLNYLTTDRLCSWEWFRSMLCTQAPTPPLYTQPIDRRSQGQHRENFIPWSRSLSHFHTLGSRYLVHYHIQFEGCNLRRRYCSQLLIRSRLPKWARFLQSAHRSKFDQEQWYHVCLKLFHLFGHMIRYRCSQIVTRTKPLQLSRSSLGT